MTRDQRYWSGLPCLVMERSTWTDERLDDLARRMDAGFDRVDKDLREVRAEMRSQFGSVRAELRSQVGSVRDELGSEVGSVHNEVGFARDEVGTVRGELAALRITMIRVGGAMIAAILTGYIGAIAAILAGG
jgi:hypothetical protein